MLTEKDYCDYETCVALKELGYVGICDAYYELTGNEDYNRDSFELLYTRDFIHPDDIDRVAAPLLYQAQKWLREEKGMLVDSMVFADNSIDADGKVVDRWIYYSCAILNTSTAEFIRSYDHSDEYDTYEEALSEGVREAIKFLKEE
jgi:hypothetical protein